MKRGTSSKLPTLLAGPILRRVEPSQVCIWIACSKDVSIRAEIFRVEAGSVSGFLEELVNHVGYVEQK